MNKDFFYSMPLTFHKHLQIFRFGAKYIIIIIVIIKLPISNWSQIDKLRFSNTFSNNNKAIFYI